MVQNVCQMFVLHQNDDCIFMVSDRNHCTGLGSVGIGAPLDQLVYIEEVGFFAKHKLVGACFGT